MQRSFERKLICRDIEFMQLRNSSRHLELGNGRVFPVHPNISNGYLLFTFKLRKPCTPEKFQEC